MHNSICRHKRPIADSSWINGTLVTLPTTVHARRRFQARFVPGMVSNLHPALRHYLCLGCDRLGLGACCKIEIGSNRYEQFRPRGVLPEVTTSNYQDKQYARYLATAVESSPWTTYRQSRSLWIVGQFPPLVRFLTSPSYQKSPSLF